MSHWMIPVMAAIIVPIAVLVVAIGAIILGWLLDKGEEK